MINCVNGCGSLYQSIYEGVKIDVCESCMGVWLDYSELTQIIQTKDKSWSNEYIESVTKKIRALGVPKIEHERKLLCPKCNEHMPPLNYQYSSGIIVNSCVSSHGIWLDSGELEKIQIFMEEWEETAKKNRSKYDSAISEVKAQHDERVTSSLSQGPSRFAFINAILLGIFKVE